MSASEQVNVASLHDVDASGSIVRTNRFELMYPTSTRRAATEIQKGLFTSIVDHAQTRQSVGVVGYDPSTGDQFEFVNGEPVLTSTSGVVQYEGRIPARYTVNQNVMKWTPQLYRILEIPAEPIPTEIDWDLFRISHSDVPHKDQHVVSDKIFKQVQKQFGTRGPLCGLFWGHWLGT